MIYTQIFLLLCASAAGALFYRMRGGKPDLPRPVEQVLFCSVLLWAMLVFGVQWEWVVISFIGAVAWCCSGHGQYFLGLQADRPGVESYDFLLRPFFGKDPRLNVQPYPPLSDFSMLSDDKWYNLQINTYGRARLYRRCLAGLALGGVLVTLFPGLAIALEGHICAGLAIALSGLLKAPVYLISDKAGKDTEGGEWGFGAVLWPVIVATVCIFWRI